MFKKKKEMKYYLEFIVVLLITILYFIGYIILAKKLGW